MQHSFKLVREWRQLGILFQVFAPSIENEFFECSVLENLR